MKKKLRKSSLRTRLILAFVATSIIPIIILNLFSYYNTAGIVKDNVNELTYSNLQQTMATMELRMNSYEDILYQIYVDDEIMELLIKINKEENLTVNRNQLRRKLQGLFWTKEYIKSIAIMTHSGEFVFYDILTGSSTQNSWLDKFGMTKQELYDEISADGNTHYFSTTKAHAYIPDENYLFHMGHRILNFKKLREQLGIVIVSIDETMLSSTYNGEKDVNSINFIVDGEGKLVSYINSGLLGEKIISWSDEISIRQKEYENFVGKQNIFTGAYHSVYVIHNDKYNWDIVNVSSQKEVIQRLQSQQKIMVIILGMSVTILIGLIMLLIKSLTGSLQNMVGAMKQAGKGDLEVRVGITSKMPAEVAFIAEQFNGMLQKLNKSMEKEREATMKQRDAEITALEAQINPHFLYNTLDTINWMAIRKSDYEISNSIGALAGILRYGIENSKGAVSIRQECEWLKKYLFLQHARFKDTFTCEVLVEPDAYHCVIHKLLLQPFVENAIIHGFEGVKRPHQLIVDIHMVEDSMIEITIYDNGRGIPKDVVEKMSQGIFVKSTEKNHIGMENAITRIQMYYGQLAKVCIESEEMVFTKISIKIPAIRENTREVCYEDCDSGR